MFVSTIKRRVMLMIIYVHLFFSHISYFTSVNYEEMYFILGNIFKGQ